MDEEQVEVTDGATDETPVATDEVTDEATAPPAGSRKMRSLAFPNTLYNAIKRDADRNQRSVNGHVMWILTEYIRRK